MDAMKKKEKMEKRKAGLVEAGLTEEEVAESLANFDALEDEAFEAVIALMKKKDEKKKEKQRPLYLQRLRKLSKRRRKKKVKIKKQKPKPAPPAPKKPMAEEAEADVTPEAS